MPAATEQHPGATDSRRTVVHGAAEWRKRLRRELLRVGAADVGLYIDGQRGTVRVRFGQGGDQLCVSVHEGLRLLRSLPDRAGVEATITVLSGR